MLPVEQPFKTYTDLDGKALQNGYVYFGLPNQNPVTAPVTVYWDAAGTQPAAQPLRTVNGYIVRAGTPANVFFSGAYSELVQDSKGAQVFYARTSDDFSIATLVSTFIANLTSSIGASVIGYILNALGAVARTVEDKLRERKSVFDFLTTAQKADVQSAAPALDLSTPLAAAAAFIAANATRYKLVFPSGIYRYSVSPNWGIQNAQIEAEGEVRLRYTGVGNAVIIDAGGASASNVYNMKMGRFIVECPSTGGNAVYVRGVHHSVLDFCVHGAGTASSGLYVAFAVCTAFPNFVCSVNEQGWYSSGKPAFGINLNIRNAGETASYCMFDNPIIEGPDIGIQLIGALGNVFMGGTSEGCTSYGVFNAAAAGGNKFFGTDFEANTSADVYCLGSGLELHGCDTTTRITFGSPASGCLIEGGRHSSLLFDVGSTLCTARDAGFNRIGFPGTFTDAGTGNAVLNLVNIIGAVRFMTGSFASTPGLIANNSTSVISVTVTGAKLGDYTAASWSASLQGMILSSYVTSANTVTVYFFNGTGAGVTLAAGTTKAMAWRQ